MSSEEDVTTTGRKTLEHLCNHIGIRWAGSENEHRAAQHLAEQFKSLGLEVETTKFHYVGWELLAEPELTFTAPEAVCVAACPYYFAAPCDVEGRLEFVGQACLTLNEGREVDATTPPGKWTGPDKYALVTNDGERAAFIVATTADEPRPGAFTDFAEPVVMVGREVKERMDAWRRDGREIRAHLKLPTRYNPQAYSHNVIATLKGMGAGTEAPPLLVIGAHYDSVYNTVGGFDNGSGVMALMDVAEHLSKQQFPITVQFVAFGAEEFDFLGSRHYIMSLKERGLLEKVVAMINLDAVGNRAADGDGWHVFRVTHDHLRSAVQAALDALRVGERFNWGEMFTPLPLRAVLFSRGSDYCFFAQEDVPAISCGANAARHGHTPLDTMENCDVEVVELKSEIVQLVVKELLSRHEACVMRDE
jgi:hypothetical protein